MRHFNYFLLFIASLIFLPHGVSAYLTTDTNQFSVDGTVGVFTIDYRFGHDKYDLTMPLRAVRGESDDTTALIYDVVDSEGRSGNGKAYAVILSEAPLFQSHYMIPKGSAHSFRLLVLYERDPSETNMLFRTQVTSLPFTFTNVQNLSLNDSELRKYTTEPLPLLKGVSVQIKSSEIR